jgi:hypothetical protein
LSAVKKDSLDLLTKKEKKNSSGNKLAAILGYIFNHGVTEKTFGYFIRPV